MIGVLLFGRFISSAHRFDWPRAIFVGLFMGLASWLYYRYKSSKAVVAA
jgi:hypothetical protein